MLCARRTVGLLLVGVLVVLTALAYASPPDPSYLGGLWDDQDYDDVVILATSTALAVDGHPGPDIAIRPVVVGDSSTAGDLRIPIYRLGSQPSRAPPLS